MQTYEVVPKEQYDNFKDKEGYFPGDWIYSRGADIWLRPAAEKGWSKETVVEIMKKRLQDFANPYHKFEYNQISDLITAFQMLMPPSMFDYIASQPPTAQGAETEGELSVKTVAQMVADLEMNAEKAAAQLQEVKATLLVNFGPTAKREEWRCVNESHTVIGMVVTAFEHIVKISASSLPPQGGAGKEAGRWVKASERLPDESDWPELHYRIDGDKADDGCLCKNDEAAIVWFEYKTVSGWKQEEDLSRVEYLSESTPSSAQEGAFAEWASENDWTYYNFSKKWGHVTNMPKTTTSELYQLFLQSTPEAKD